MLCSALTDQLLFVAPCAGRWGRTDDKGPSGCGFRQGCFAPSALGQGPHFSVRISSGTGEQPDVPSMSHPQGPRTDGSGVPLWRQATAGLCGRR